MFNFKDPSEFASTVPPVPDIKVWLQEFRSKHPYQNHHNNEQYKEQLSSLNTRNDTLRMEFETMAINNKNIVNDQKTLKSEHDKLNNEYITLQFQHNQLKEQYQCKVDEIAKLKQQITELQESNTNHSNNENINTTNQIQWNFECGTKATHIETNSVRKESRKRPRSEISQSHDSSDEKKTVNKKLKTTRSCSVNPDSILEKRLPTNLDLIRGDILAEAGGDEQIQCCFNMLKKCSTDEWQLRNFLMSMITGLGEENGNISYNIVYDARHSIKKQLTDLRSTVVKTTCEMLIAFSKYCDDTKYGQCFAYFIPIHLQGLYVTIACIRDAHNECLTKSIHNTMSFKCITPLLKGLTNKHSEVRVKVIHLLSSLIISDNNNLNNKKMEKYADAIGNTIKTYVSDANSSVRNAVKQLFENFAKQFPHRSKMLLSRMDINSQKTLRKCIGNKDKNTKTKYKTNYGQTRTRRK